MRFSLKYFQLSNVCNNRPDCPDGSDESSCFIDPSPPATPSCSLGYFPCDGNVCFPLAAMCDKKPDCTDGFDELNCTSSTVRVFQVLQMGVDERGINESSLLLYWWIPIPEKKLEFLPSISKSGENRWENKTWTEQTDYHFSHLEPFTKYNMTVYVRVKGSNTVFPPAKYHIATTGEGFPSEPWNVTVEQRNGSHILVTWNPPKHPNGIIQFYDVCWYPPLPPIKLKLSDNGTAHLLTANFQHNTTYSFYIIAHNRAHESKTSEVKSIVFDRDSQVEIVTDLAVKGNGNNSITLSWNYSKQADKFVISVQTPGQNYPRLPSLVTKTNNITLKNLAPGIYFTFKIAAVKKLLRGPESTISVLTNGTSLPIVPGLQTEVLKNVAPTVKISWKKPFDDRTTKWVYGVYYGLNEDSMLSESKYNTSDLTAIIENLDACEKYMFSVGVIGPYGFGPLTLPQIVTTHFNKLAPPKRLTVGRDSSDETKMLVQWSASCPIMNEPIGYQVLSLFLLYNCKYKRYDFQNKLTLKHIFYRFASMNEQKRKKLHTK